MKVVKILGVVFGALFLLTGIALLAGLGRVRRRPGQVRPAAGRAGAGRAGQRHGDRDRAARSTPSTTSTSPAPPQTGRGQVAEGTTPPDQGDDVQVYYSTLDPSQIIILDFPGGNFAGVAGLLRTIAIVCLVIGAVLLVAGIIGLVTARRRAAAVNAGATGYPAVAPLSDQAPGPARRPRPGRPRPRPPRPGRTSTRPRPSPSSGTRRTGRVRRAGRTHRPRTRTRSSTAPAADPPRRCTSSRKPVTHSRFPAGNCRR